MKRLMLILFSALVITSACNTNKEKADRGDEGQPEQTTTPATVDIAPDDQLTRAVDYVVKGYKNVHYKVAGGVVTLQGEVSRQDHDKLMQEIQATKPKEIKDELKIK